MDFHTICAVCGKRRGDRNVNHDACSKQLQAVSKAQEAKPHVRSNGEVSRFPDGNVMTNEDYKKSVQKQAGRAYRKGKNLGYWSKIDSNG